jgi:NRPS condensation-like uncharacterized protein
MVSATSVAIIIRNMKIDRDCVRHKLDPTIGPLGGAKQKEDCSINNTQLPSESMRHIIALQKTGGA